MKFTHGFSCDAPTLSRRACLSGVVVSVGSLAIGARDSWAAPEDGLTRSSEAIHQEPVLKASPKRVYEALLDAQQFQKVELLSLAMDASTLTAKPAKIGREVGSSFSLFGDFIVGRQLELVPNQRIVQAWREISWPAGIHSIVKFELAEQGSGTRIIFDHTGFPAGNGEHLAAGWKAHYWDALEKFLA